MDILNNKTGIKLFWILFSFTALALAGMQITGTPLITDAAPAGIVTFELIGTLAGSQHIIDSWQDEKMTYAGINMGLDFLFLFLYGLTIALACLLVAIRLPENWKVFKRLGPLMALAAIMAAVLDMVENMALIKLLLGSANEWLPVVAKWCAIPKFLIVMLAILYVIVCIVPISMNRKAYP